MLMHQQDLYAKALCHDSKVTFVRCNRYHEAGYGATVVAKQYIPRGKGLGGQCAPSFPVEVRKKNINDFSVIHSKSRAEKLFLGPAAYINHNCNASVQWYAAEKPGFMYMHKPEEGL